MTSSNQNPMDVLSALVEERIRYERWLTQLEARRGATPPHVFDRVRSDYTERLTRVHDQLAGRTTELQATVTTLADQVASLLADENTLRDERAEAELRAAVGEFSAEQAQAVMQRCDEAITSLGAQRQSVGAELGRVQEILSVAMRPPTPPSGEPPVVPIESLAPAARAQASAPLFGARDPAAPEPPAPAPAVTSPAAATASHFDELAFLQSVVDRPTMPPPADARTSSPDPYAEPRHLAPKPAPVRSPAIEDFAPEPVAAANAPQGRRNAASTPILTSAPMIEKEGPEQNSALTPASIPAFLKDVPTEQIKTLKCQECGTMNYPTEWYCERCGGELAAM